ncbi:MAG: hypothetical protein JO006_16995 [Paucibacter sp.]|nr:hypothetical protein [Roseateles sp.]
MQRRVRTILLCALLGLQALPSFAADGLQLDVKRAELGSSPWQARFQLSNLDADRLGSKVLSLNLLGDYYLTNSGMNGVSGGLRATGGMLLGPLSLTQSSAGLALGDSSVHAYSLGQRSLRLGSDFNDPGASMSYMGIGYTGHVMRGGLSFSADLGLMSNLALSGLRLGNAAAPIDEVLRDMRYKPLLQLGLSYRY